MLTGTVPDKKYRNDSISFYNNKGELIQHSEVDKHIFSSREWILESGVCPLGKFGAWVIIIWSSVIIGIICTNKINNTEPHTIKKTNKILGIINSIIMGIILILTFFMNFPLFIRTSPFFLIQIVISLILFDIIKIPENKNNITT